MAVGLQQHFGVGPGREGVAEPFELRPQVLMIVDLAVEYDPLRGSACRHRLRPAGGEVEDGQSAVPQPHAERSVAVPVRGVRYDGVMELTPAHPTEQEALAIRSTVRLKVVHALQDRRVDRAAQTDRAYDPAHGACSSCLGVRIRSPPLRESLAGGLGEILVTSSTQEACRTPLGPFPLAPCGVGDSGPPSGSIVGSVPVAPTIYGCRTVAGEIRRGTAPEEPRRPGGVPAPACNDAQPVALLNETQTLRCRSRLPAAE